MPLIAGVLFKNDSKIVQGIPSQSISNTTIDGAALVNPQHKFNQLVIEVNGGAFAASASGVVLIEERAIVGGAWTSATESDGTTALEFLQTLYDDAGAGENATLFGTLPLGDFDWETIDALRVTFESEGAQAMLVGINYILTNAIRSDNADDTDYLFAKVHGGQ